MSEAELVSSKQVYQFFVDRKKNILPEFSGCIYHDVAEAYVVERVTYYHLPSDDEAEDQELYKQRELWMAHNIHWLHEHAQGGAKMVLGRQLACWHANR